jgi:hypothetical protein
VDAAKDAPVDTAPPVDAAKDAPVDTAPPVDANDAAPDSSKPPVDASDAAEDTSKPPVDASDAAEDTSRPPRDAAKDAPADAAPPADSGTGVNCPDTPCSNGEVCCADPTANPMVACAATCDPSDNVACLQPSDCSGDTPVCCVDAVMTSQGLSCTISTSSSQCTTGAACPSNVSMNCGEETFPMCNSSADCASDDSCCPLPMRGLTVRGCVSSSYHFMGCN